MEGGEDWRMRRCGGGGVASTQDKPLIMNQTMFKFRPIAPKPAVNGDGGTAAGHKHSVLTAGRTKRKYVRACRNIVGDRRKNKQTTTKGGEETSGVVHLTEGGRYWVDLNQIALGHKTLVTSSRDEILTSDCRVFDLSQSKMDHPSSSGQHHLTEGAPSRISLPVQEDHHDVPKWLTNYIHGGGGGPSGDLPAVGILQRTRGVLKVESWVMVECVTGSCLNVEEPTFGRRSTDAERIRNLEEDTCPGFISDGENRVRWLNGSFRRMVSEQKYMSAIAVWLVVKDKLPYNNDDNNKYSSSGLTCQVKLQYLMGKKEKCFRRVVPSDMWRLDGGGSAWRLDVESALTLGR